MKKHKSETMKTRYMIPCSAFIRREGEISSANCGSHYELLRVVESIHIVLTPTTGEVYIFQQLSLLELSHCVPIKADIEERIFIIWVHRIILRLCKYGFIVIALLG